MALTQIIYLTQANFGVHPVVHAVQNDTGRSLKMVIKDVALSGSPTAELYFTRSDETHFSVNAEFDSQDNSFTADISQALTQAGNTRCNLTVTDSNDKTVSSYPFLIIVHESQDGTSEAQLGYSIEEITEIIDAVRGGALTEDVKQALLNCFYHVAWTDEHGQDYVDALEAALYPPANLVRITAVYTQSGTVYNTDSLDSLKEDLVVTAHYDNGTSEVVTAYTLSGTLTPGTSTITVGYGGKTTTFTVQVTFLDNTIKYELATATTFTGSNSIETGIAPEDADRDWSINLEITNFGSISGRRIFIMGANTNQCGVEYYNSNVRAQFGDPTQDLFNPANLDNTKPIRIIVTHSQGSNDIVASYSYTASGSSTITTDNKTITTNKSSIVDNSQLYIGKFAQYGQNISGITITEFVVRYRVLNSTEISTYLNGGAI